MTFASPAKSPTTLAVSYHAQLDLKLQIAHFSNLMHHRIYSAQRASRAALRTPCSGIDAGLTTWVLPLYQLPQRTTQRFRTNLSRAVGTGSTAVPLANNTVLQ